jgi:cytoskeletal protein RodZ
VKQFLNGYFYKIALGVGVLVLVVLVAADIWLWQSDDAPVVTQGTSNETNVPGFPSRNNDSNRSSASATDSIELEIQRDGEEITSGLIVGDGAAVQDSFTLETSGDVPGATIGDGANIGDSAVTLVEEGQPPPPPPSGGGPSDAAKFGDSADLVVRDADGNIKNQESVK